LSVRLFDHPSQEQVGDFGTFDKTTGDLIVEGNIYDLKEFTELATKYPASTNDEDKPIEIHSSRVVKPSTEDKAGANPSDAQDVLFTTQWQFNASRGAILLMYKPQMKSIPDEIFTPSLLGSPALKNKWVVSQVWTCPGFYMYLSSRSNEKVTVSLREDVTSPVDTNVDSSHSRTFSWSAEGCIGLRQHAYQPDSNYTPLFYVRPIR